MSAVIARCSHVIWCSTLKSGPRNWLRPAAAASRACGSTGAISGEASDLCLVDSAIPPWLFPCSPRPDAASRLQVAAPESSSIRLRAVPYTEPVPAPSHPTPSTHVLLLIFQLEAKTVQPSHSVTCTARRAHRALEARFFQHDNTSQTRLASAARKQHVLCQQGRSRDRGVQRHRQGSRAAAGCRRRLRGDQLLVRCCRRRRARRQHRQ